MKKGKKKKGGFLRREKREQKNLRENLRVEKKKE